MVKVWGIEAGAEGGAGTGGGELGQLSVPSSEPSSSVSTSILSVKSIISVLNVSTVLFSGVAPCPKVMIDVWSKINGSIRLLTFPGRLLAIVGVVLFGIRRLRRLTIHLPLGKG